MSIQVPDGMSSVCAFLALYDDAKLIGLGNRHPQAGIRPYSPWEVIQVFKAYCPGGSCDYVRGKYMPVNFRKFPEIDVRSYDKHYGDGAAMKAFQAFQNRLVKSDPDEKYDLNSRPCTFFTTYHKYQYREWGHSVVEEPMIMRYEGRDLLPMFEKCERIEKEEKRVEKLVEEAQPSPIFDSCKVDYALATPPIDYIGHSYKSCQSGLSDLKMLLQTRKHFDTMVADLSICRYNRHMPILKSCKRLSNEVSIDSATKLLESQTPKE